MTSQETSVVFANRHQNPHKKRLIPVERFMTKKVIAMAVREVFGSLAITRARLNLRFP
jgi:hypothetical protein